MGLDTRCLLSGPCRNSQPTSNEFDWLCSVASSLSNFVYLGFGMLNSPTLQNLRVCALGCDADPYYCPPPQASHEAPLQHTAMGGTLPTADRDKHQSAVIWVYLHQFFAKPAAGGVCVHASNVE